MKRALSVLLVFTCLATKSERSLSCDGLDFFEQWVRKPVSGMEITAAYFSVANTTLHPLEITSLRSPTLKSVTLHKTIYDDGLSKMRPVVNLTIPPNSTVRAAPGGLHLMLEGDFSAHNKEIDIEFICNPDSVFITFPFATCD